MAEKKEQTLEEQIEAGRKEIADLEAQEKAAREEIKRIEAEIDKLTSENKRMIAGSPDGNDTITNKSWAYWRSTVEHDPVDAHDITRENILHANINRIKSLEEQLNGNNPYNGMRYKADLITAKKEIALRKQQDRLRQHFAKAYPAVEPIKLQERQPADVRKKLNNDTKKVARKSSTEDYMKPAYWKDLKKKPVEQWSDDDITKRIRYLKRYEEIHRRDSSIVVESNKARGIMSANDAKAEIKKLMAIQYNRSKELITKWQDNNRAAAGAVKEAPETLTPVSNQSKTKQEVEETMSDDAKKATKAKKAVSKGRTYTARPIEGLKTLDGIGLPSGMTIPEPNRPDIKIGEVKFQPTVTVVPRIKKNGKPSKHFNDIMYTDENNQQHRITKDKAQGKSWKETLKVAEEGKLKPKDAAKFFETKAKEQPTPVKVSETTTDKRKYTDKNGYEVTFAHDDNGVCTSMTIKAPGGMQYTVTAEDYTKKGNSGPETLKGDYAFVTEVSNPEYSDFTAMYKTAKDVGHNTTKYADIIQKGNQNG